MKIYEKAIENYEKKLNLFKEKVEKMAIDGEGCFCSCEDCPLTLAKELIPTLEKSCSVYTRSEIAYIISMEIEEL